METNKVNKIKLLKDGDAKFYIKSFSDRDFKTGKKLISAKNNKPYFSAIFRVTDSEGTIENIYKYFNLDFRKDILKLLKSIGKIHLAEYLDLPDFDWEDLEDESGLCRIEVKDNDKYGKQNSIESFIKKDMEHMDFKRTTEHCKEQKQDISSDFSQSGMLGGEIMNLSSSEQYLKASGLNNILASPTFVGIPAQSAVEDDIPF